VHRLNLTLLTPLFRGSDLPWY